MSDPISILHSAKASGADMPFPCGVPESLQQHNPKQPIDIPEKKSSVDGNDPEQGPSSVGLANFNDAWWDDSNGWLVLQRSDGSQVTIVFSACP